VDKKRVFEKKTSVFMKVGIDRFFDFCYDKIHRRLGDDSENRKDF
jgi:hypothetical protein